MKLPKNKEIIPPENGWKESTYYVMEVAYNKANPIHRKIFYCGFLDKGKPGNYSQFFEGNDNGPTYNSSLKDIYYGKVILEIPLRIQNP